MTGNDISEQEIEEAADEIRGMIWEILKWLIVLALAGSFLMIGFIWFIQEVIG